MKKALIIGHTGQDGTYLSRILSKKKYAVAGYSGKNAISFSGKKISTINILHPDKVEKLILKTKPEQVYFLAAVHQSSSDKHVDEGDLFRKSIELNFIALVNFLDAIRKHSIRTRIFYAASSHVFGNPGKKIQDEQTVLAPDSIYGTTKTAGIHACRYYRQRHGVFASVGIFYNHESPLRSSKFVSKKIVEAGVAIKLKKQSKLTLGDLNAKIDWGYAPDYMDAASRIMLLKKPGEFIVSSGEQHTVKEFVRGVFDYLGLDWKKYVTEQPGLITKKLQNNLFGDHSKLKSETKWKPAVSFQQLIRVMTDNELAKYE